MGRPIVRSNVLLADVTVRPVNDRSERAEWDRLMDAHHYLGFRCLFGGGLRHVAEDSTGRWLALVGWGPASFKVKIRDDWIGWLPEQQFRRLHLVSCNSRFLILPEMHDRNLASRVLSLSLRRLSSDTEARHGHPVFLAETFVDPRFAGTCYRATNWTALGETRGYARVGNGWVMHGVRKRMFVRALVIDARDVLSGLDEPGSMHTSRRLAEPPPVGRLRSLYEFLIDEVVVHRSSRGMRHRRATVLAVIVSARLAGAKGTRATAEFAARFSQNQLAAVRAFRCPSAGRLVPPSKSTIHRVLSELDRDLLHRTVGRWVSIRRKLREVRPVPTWVAS